MSDNDTSPGTSPGTPAPLAPGQKGYQAYAAQLHGTNTKGEPLPSWAELRPAIQEGWAAAEAAYLTTTQ